MYHFLAVRLGREEDGGFCLWRSCSSLLDVSDLGREVDSGPYSCRASTPASENNLKPFRHALPCCSIRDYIFASPMDLPESLSSNLRAGKTTTLSIRTRILLSVGLTGLAICVGHALSRERVVSSSSSNGISWEQCQERLQGARVTYAANDSEPTCMG